MFEVLMLCSGMLLTGIVAGLMAGLLGVGGGLVIVPMLDLSLGFMGVDPSIRMQIAVATSLATIVPTSIASSRAHYRRGAVDVDLAKKWVPWIFIGALLGAWVASQVHSQVLSGVFACVALLVALKLLLPLDARAASRTVPAGPAFLPVPALIGFISTLMGIGGGSISVPVLTYFGTSIHRAVGTSALFGLLIAVPGTLGFMLTGHGNPLLPYGNVGFVSLPGFALIAPATVLAAPFGVRLAHSMEKRHLTMLFGTFLLIVSVRMLMRAVQA